MTHVLALDFDGVVADTERECYTISLPAFRRMGERIEENDRLRAQFRKARPYVKHADCYYTILKILQDPAADFDAISFGAFAAEREKNKEKGKEFHRLFYEERAKLQKDTAAWIALNPAFEGIPTLIKDLMQSMPVIIVTAKDKHATQLILESYGLTIPEKNILPKEFSMDKRDHMRWIAGKFTVPFENIIFVEDNLEQLLTVRELGVKLVFAAWGYNTEQQRQEAARLSITVVTKETFEQAVRTA